MKKFVLTEVKDDVLYITINNNKYANALDFQVMEQLRQAFLLPVSNEKIKVVKLSSVGKHFCAGWNLKVALKDREQAIVLDRLGAELASAIESCPAVTVAELKAGVAGGGLVIALACDFRIGSDDLMVLLPEVNLGAPLLWNGLSGIACEIGLSATRELAFLGEIFDSKWALENKVISKVVSRNKLEEETDEIISVLLSKDVGALRFLKRDLIKITNRSYPAGNSFFPSEIMDFMSNENFSG